MKRIITFLAVIFTAVSIYAQTPDKMSYQAVIRDISGLLVTNQSVGMKISVLQGSVSGTVVYSEIFNPNPATNENGLVTVQIGGGVPMTGTFNSINWGTGPYFIKVETDPAGGTNYTISGTSQLLSVPYALHAKTAETVTGGVSETDPVFGASPANGISNTNISNWNSAYSWGDHSTAGYMTSEVDGSITNELQVLSISNDTIRLTNGGFVKLPAGFSGNYNDLINKPTIPTVPTNVGAFTNDAGYLTSFTEVDGSTTNELQVLSISNDTIKLSNGGFAKLPAGFSGNYNDLTNKPVIPTVPSNVSAFTNDAGYLTSFTEIDGSITNELQVLSISNDTVRLTNGGFIKLPAGFSGNYNDLTNKPTNISTFTNDAGYLTSFTEVDGSVTNEIQILSISNDTIRLSSGGFVKLPVGFDGNYNSLSNKPTIPTVPTNVSAFTNDAGYLTSFTEVDGSTTNEIQTISLSGSDLSISGGNTVTLPSSGGSSGFQVFTSSGTFTVPEGVTQIIVEVVGGGGGGGAGSGYENYAGGGGGGGYGKGYFSVLSGETYSVVVGSGGIGAVYTSGYTAGAAGGSSSFGSLISATGGAGGGAALNANGLGGTSSAMFFGVGQTGSTHVTVLSGHPSSTIYGYGGAGGHSSSNKNGYNGVVIVYW